MRILPQATEYGGKQVTALLEERGLDRGWGLRVHERQKEEDEERPNIYRKGMVRKRGEENMTFYLPGLERMSMPSSRRPLRRIWRSLGSDYR